LNGKLYEGRIPRLDKPLAQGNGRLELDTVDSFVKPTRWYRNGKAHRSPIKPRPVLLFDRIGAPAHEHKPFRVVIDKQTYLKRRIGLMHDAVDSQDNGMILRERSTSTAIAFGFNQLRREVVIIPELAPEFVQMMDMPPRPR
jgi:hypothetical protein